MELGKDLVEALFQESDQIDIIAFKNALYLKLAQNYLRYRWVITYLFAVSYTHLDVYKRQVFHEYFVQYIQVIKNRCLFQVSVDVDYLRSFLFFIK